MMLSRIFGGMERLFIDRTMALLDQGHHIQAICRGEFDAHAKVLARGGATIELLPSCNQYNPALLWKLRRKIRAFAPDAIHADSGNATSLAARACRWLSIPVVTQLHNFRFEDRGQFQRHYRHATHFIALTDEMRDRLIRVGVNPMRISVVPNFTNVQRVPTVPPMPSSADAFRFVSFGRFVGYKGFDVLVRAFSEVRRVRPQATLRIGGAGPEEQDLRRLSAALNLGDSLQWVGWVEHVSALLDSSDAFVLPSREEPFGIVLLEAMARGKPIITTRTSGPQQMLDPHSATFADPNHPESLAAAMIEAMDNPKETACKAEHALRQFDSQFCKAAIVAQLDDVYRHAAGAVRRDAAASSERSGSA